MAQKKLLTNGKAFKRTDDRWGGTVWYMDEKGERKRKSFSGTTKAEVTKKMTDYVAAFNATLHETDEFHKTLRPVKIAQTQISDSIISLLALALKSNGQCWQYIMC